MEWRSITDVYQGTTSFEVAPLISWLCYVFINSTQLNKPPNKRKVANKGKEA